jgi:pyridoxamine 5'-phosphate oxidase
MDMMHANDPFPLFQEWFETATDEEFEDPNAMSVATASADGRVSARIVLLKEFDRRGFVFYTNLMSHKGDDLLENPSAALCFHWKSLRRQVRIEGRVEQVSDAEADRYFRSRPRDSQIGAWASRQSQPLPDRTVLEERIREFDELYGSGAVLRPTHWSGYRVVPDRIEFWKARPFRLHDRLLFSLERGAWVKRVLYP